MNRIVTIASALSLTAMLGACASSGGQSAQSTTSEGSGSAGMQVAAADSSKARLDPDAVRCKTEIKTGTRISSKVCKTNREWEQEAIDSRQATEKVQRGGLNTGHNNEGGG